jgi:hypothetical protein
VSRALLVFKRAFQLFEISAGYNGKYMGHISIEEGPF